MKHKRLTLTIIAALLSTTMVTGQTAAEWAKKEKEKLDAITPASLVEIAKGAPDSYRKIFAEVKPDYKSDPVQLTRIAALTQIITSKAKKTPAIGALKIAAIPPAAPQATRFRTRSSDK